VLGKIKLLLKNDNILSLLGNVVVAVFGLLSFFVLARILPIKDLGEWVLFITAGNFIEMMRFGITRTAIIRFLSGSKEEERQKFIGSNWVISIKSTLIIIGILWLTLILLKSRIEFSGYYLFFMWYPVLSIINLPFNNAISILSADLKFREILFLRLFNNATFVGFLAFYYFYQTADINIILYAYLIINVATSAISMYYKWDGWNYIKKATKNTNKIILNFGKYTTGTLIGSNLLKSADIFIIGLSPFLKAEGVALFSIPIKLTEILEIPVRSFLSTVFPHMSKASIENNLEEVKRLFYSYAGALSFIFLPVIALCFIFAEELCIILGGREYVSAANIFRVFCIYGMLIPIDRLTGVALDSINKPRQNFFKVIYMVIANVIGDIIAVFVITAIFPSVPVTEVLMMVAMATIIMTIIGVIVGFHFLNKEISIQFDKIFIIGWKFFKQNIRKFSFLKI